MWNWCVPPASSFRCATVLTWRNHPWARSRWPKPLCYSTPCHVTYGTPPCTFPGFRRHNLWKAGGTASESGPTPYEKLPQIEPAVEVHLELSECRRWLRSTQALIATLDLAQSSVPQRLANQLADLSPKLPGPKGFQHVVPLHVVTSSRLPRPILFLVHPAVSGPSYLLSFLCHPWWLLPAPLHTRLPYGSGASYAVIPAFDSGWYPVAGNPVDNQLRYHAKGLRTCFILLDKGLRSQLIHATDYTRYMYKGTPIMHIRVGVFSQWILVHMPIVEFLPIESNILISKWCCLYKSHVFLITIQIYQRLECETAYHFCPQSLLNFTLPFQPTNPLLQPKGLIL